MLCSVWFGIVCCNDVRVVLYEMFNTFGCSVWFGIVCCNDVGVVVLYEMFYTFGCFCYLLLFLFLLCIILDVWLFLFLFLFLLCIILCVDFCFCCVFCVSIFGFVVYFAFFISSACHFWGWRTDLCINSLSVSMSFLRLTYRPLHKFTKCKHVVFEADVQTYA
jgi:hypothetical protein